MGAMKDLVEQVEAALRLAVVSVLGEAFAQADPMVRPAQDPKRADFQANMAMGLAKRAGIKPRELAEKIVATLGDGDGLLKEKRRWRGRGLST